MNKIKQFLNSFESSIEYDYIQVCNDLQCDLVQFMNELDKHRDRIAYCRYDGKITLVYKG